MDDLAPPRVLVDRTERMLRDIDDLATVLRARGEEWALALDRLDRALPSIQEAVELARLAARVAKLAGKEDPTWRAGDWCLTVSGKRFWPLDPRPVEVEPLDIAHALAGKARWGAHSIRVYSVGAHSLRVKAMAEVMARQEGQDIRRTGAFAVLHDSDEAYLPDVPRPIKPFLPGWLEIEERVRQAVYDRFGLGVIPYEIRDIVQRADDYALAIEARALMPHWDESEASHPGEYPEDPAVAAAGQLADPWLGKEAVERALLEAIRQTVPDYHLPADVVAAAEAAEHDPEAAEMEAAWEAFIRGTTYRDKPKDVQADIRHTFVGAWMNARQGMARVESDDAPAEATTKPGAWADTLQSAAPAEDARTEKWKRMLEDG